MSTLPADQRVEDVTPDAEIMRLIADPLDEHGSEPAALRALTHDFIILLADADRSVPRASRAACFSQGAMPVRGDDEP